MSIGDSTYTVTLRDEDQIEIDDSTYTYDLHKTGQGAYSLILNGLTSEIYTGERKRSGNTEEFFVNGIPLEVMVDDQRSLLRKSMMQSRSTASAFQAIKAPMPGKVVRVEVNAGDIVKPGTGLIVLEAMKMENEIKATAVGTIKDVKVAAGKAVEKGELLMTIESK